MKRRVPAKSALAIVTFALLVEPAVADLRGFSTEASLFSQEELAVITRNQTLTKAVKINPWVVREFLDAVGDANGKSIQTRQSMAPRPPAREPIDSATDPDLEGMQRASPEAVHDLFQLLKRASQKNEGKAK